MLRFGTGMVSAVLPHASVCGRTNMCLRPPERPRSERGPISQAHINEIARQFPMLGRMHIIVRRRGDRDELHLRIEHAGSGAVDSLGDGVSALVHTLTHWRGYGRVRAARVVGGRGFPRGGRAVAELSLADHAINSVIPNVLSIAGSDPSGGAGIQADLKTFAALGCHGMAAIAALTAQNTLGVAAVHLPPPSFVAEQIASVLADADVAAIKVGMLGSRAIVEAVADALTARPGVPLVLDPVLVATSGAALGDDGVIAAMRARLFPLATLVTPNLFEAVRLAGEGGTATREEMEALARTLKGEGSAAWLIKGGHRDGGRAEDYLLGTDLSQWFSSPARRDAQHAWHRLHAVFGHRRFPRTWPRSRHGRRSGPRAYLGEALAGADALSAGRGAGPVDHFVRWQR